MSNIKLKDHNWDTTGVYDSTLGKTQRQVNADLTSNKVNTSDYAPATKTSEMTQSVGKDSSGKLWTTPVSSASIVSATETWLANNITQETGYVIDDSLSVEGAAADAASVGDLKSAFDDYKHGLLKVTPFVSNSYVNRAGKITGYSGWSRTDYIDVSWLDAIVVKSSVASTFNCFFSEKSESGFVSYFGVETTEKTQEIPPTAKYIIFSNTNQGMTDLTVKCVTERDTFQQKLEKNINKLANAIPDYYEPMMTSKANTINGLHSLCAENGDSLVFVTDTHYSYTYFTQGANSLYNTNNTLSLLNYVVKNTGIGHICFGGDLVHRTEDVPTMLRCLSVFIDMLGANKTRLRFCVGNHEYFTGADNGVTVKPTTAELYGSSIKFNEDIIISKGPMETYSYDNILQKTRYFIVSCGRHTETSALQIKWLLSEFERIPAGYHVVCIGHAFINDAMNAFRGGYADIAEALDTVKSRGAYTYNNTTFDYSGLNDVDVVCMLTGHTHVDGSLVTAGGIPCICTTTDAYSLNYVMEGGVPTSSPRTAGTTDEQAFDVVQFDYTNRKIYCTRIGYGSDREFSY